MAGIIGILFISLCFVFAEFFIPSFGALTVMALSLATWAIWRAFGLGRAQGFGALAGFVVVLAFDVWAGFKLFQRSPLILRKTQRNAPPADEGLRRYVGRTGVVSSTLRPSGRVVVDEATCDAISDGTVIESGVSVEVVGTRHGALLVKRKA